MDLARLGIVVESDGVATASNRLGELEGRGRQMEGGAQRLERQFSSMHGVVGQLAHGLGLLGIAFSARQAISEVMAFDVAMQKVRAMTQATGEDFARLEQSARQLGATTAFSAREAAEGMTFLGMAGFDINEILSAMPDALNLAIAGTMELGQAADIASNIMTSFGIAASEMSDVGDVIAHTAANANTNVVQLGEAMSYSASTAGALGLDLRDTASALATLAGAGIQGSRAGTNLVATLRQLTKVTPQAEAILDNFGLSVEDVSIQAHGFNEVMRRLSDSGLVKDSEAMFRVFGEAATAAVNFANAAEAGQEFRDSLDDVTGAMERMAGQMGDTLTGDLKALNSAWNELWLALNESTGSMDLIRTAVQGLTTGLRFLGENTEWVIENFVSFKLTIKDFVADTVGGLAWLFNALGKLPGASGETGRQLTELWRGLSEDAAEYNNALVHMIGLNRGSADALKNTANAASGVSKEIDKNTQSFERGTKAIDDYRSVAIDAFKGLSQQTSEQTKLNESLKQGTVAYEKISVAMKKEQAVREFSQKLAKSGADMESRTVQKLIAEYGKKADALEGLQKQYNKLGKETQETVGAFKEAGKEKANYADAIEDASKALKENVSEQGKLNKAMDDTIDVSEKALKSLKANNEEVKVRADGTIQLVKSYEQEIHTVKTLGDKYETLETRYEDVGKKTEGAIKQFDSLDVSVKNGTQSFSAYGDNLQKTGDTARRTTQEVEKLGNVIDSMSVGTQDAEDSLMNYTRTLNGAGKMHEHTTLLINDTTDAVKKVAPAVRSEVPNVMRVFEDLSSRITTTLARGIEDFITKGITDLSSFWDTFKQMAISAISQVAAVSVAQMMGLAPKNGIGISQLFGLFGGGGSKGLTAGLAAQNQVSGGMIGAAGGGLSLTKILGAGGLGFAGGGLLQGLLGGNQLGGGIGGGLGAAIGMAIAGPVGAAIAGTLGSIVGGLFGGKSPNLSTAGTFGAKNQVFQAHEESSPMFEEIRSTTLRFKQMVQDVTGEVNNLTFHTEAGMRDGVRVWAEGAAQTGATMVALGNDFLTFSSNAEGVGMASRALMETIILETDTISDAAKNMIFSMQGAGVEFEKFAEQIIKIDQALPQLTHVFGDLGLEGFNQAAEALGGVDRMLQLMADSAEQFGLTSELAGMRLAEMEIRAQETFAQLGTTVDTFWDDFRYAVESGLSPDQLVVWLEASETLGHMTHAMREMAEMRDLPLRLAEEFRQNVEGRILQIVDPIEFGFQRIVEKQQQELAEAEQLLAAGIHIDLNRLHQLHILERSQYWDRVEGSERRRGDMVINTMERANNSIQSMSGASRTAANSIHGAAGSLHSAAGSISSAAGSISSAAGNISAAAGNIAGAASYIRNTTANLTGAMNAVKSLSQATSGAPRPSAQSPGAVRYISAGANVIGQTDVQKLLDARHGGKAGATQVKPQSGGVQRAQQQSGGVQRATSQPIQRATSTPVQRATGPSPQQQKAQQQAAQKAQQQAAQRAKQEAAHAAKMNERANLERQLLTLQGNTAELRKRELKDLHPSNRAIQKRIWALEQERERVERNNQIRAEREGLENRLYALEGNRAKIREREREGIHKSNHAIQRRIWAMEDERAVIDRITAVMSANRSFFQDVMVRTRQLVSPFAAQFDQLIVEQHRRLEQARSMGMMLNRVHQLNRLEQQALIKEVTQPFQDFLKSIDVDRISRGSVQEQMQHAQREFNQAVAKARRGAVDPQTVVAAGQNLLALSEKMFASGPQFAQRMEFVEKTIRNTMGQVEKTAKNQLSTAARNDTLLGLTKEVAGGNARTERQLKELNNQLRNLRQINVAMNRQLERMRRAA